MGNAIGARGRDEVPRLVEVTLAGAVAWQALVALAYLLLSRRILTLFVAAAPSAPALLDTGATLLVLSAAWTLFEALAATYAEALAAAGDTAVMLRARAALYTSCSRRARGCWSAGWERLHGGDPVVHRVRRARRWPSSTGASAAAPGGASC